MLAWHKRHPAGFSLVDECHRDKGRPPLPDWPDWCYAPIAAAFNAVGPLDAATVTAMATWRMTQGIYRFDPTLYASLIDTPVTGDLPTDILYQLPEWCVYIETPHGVDYSGTAVRGAFCWLEFDTNNNNQHELRMLLDIGDDDSMLMPCIVHLGGSIESGIELARAEIKKRVGINFGTVIDAWAEPAQRIASLLLYMCSVSDYQRHGRPGMPANPVPKRTKRGMRLFGVPNPATWDVGVRMGAALRQAYQVEQMTTGSTHAGPRGHIRRGHWHSFRAGPMKNKAGEPIPTERRQLRLQWLPPIAVNLLGLDALPAVVRPVNVRMGSPS